jgi:uncharacterized membrane protein YbhN (UPF0104 family)
MHLRNKRVKSILGISIGLVLISHIVYTLLLNPGFTYHSFIHFFNEAQNLLLILVLLLLLSSGIEIVKWKLLLSSQQEVSWKQASSSVFIGQAASFVTPNRIGDYPARILSLNNKLTYGTITLSILSASAQTLAILIVSEIAFLNLMNYLRTPLFSLLFEINSIIIIGMLFFYFKIEVLSVVFSKLKILKKIKKYIHVIQVIPKKLYISAFILSVIKFSIYSFQLYLLLHLSNLELSPHILYMLSIIYFWGLTIIPSIAFAELGIRNKWGLFLFSLLAIDNWKITIIITSLWLINIVFPAFIGVLIWFYKQSKNKWYASVS